MWLYRFLIAPLALFFLPAAALFNRKLRAGLGLRLKSLPASMRLSKNPLWIHAASGEFEYAKALIREFKSREPERSIVVTYFSPSFAKAVENFPGVDLAYPLPLDLPGPLSSFLKRVRPSALLIARTDFWPELLAQTRRFKIPVHVFSYTQKDLRGHPLSRWWRARLLNQCDGIHCVSETDRDSVVSLGVRSRVSVGGDTRYDQVDFRLNHPKKLPLNLAPHAPCMVAGSTWDEDEDVLIPALRPLLETRRMQLILVPHEPTSQHIKNLKTKLQGLDFAVFSETREWTNPAVLVVDQVGYLAELYAYAQMAFIGGSFKGSVHSVMEALGAGAMTFVGPYHANNREAIEFQSIQVGATPAVQVVQSAEDLCSKVETLLHEPGQLPIRHHDLKRVFQSRLGASRKLYEELRGSLSAY